MNSTNVIKFARKSKRVRRSIWAHGSGWGRDWLKLLSAHADGYEPCMRWPGERMPPPPSSGLHWDVQDEDWELAASRT